MHRWFVSLLALLALPAWASAVSLTFTWNPVATNVDGSPAVVEYFTFYRSTDNGSTFTKFACQEQTADPKLTGRLCTDAALPMGQDCFQVTASNLAGESKPSNRLCFSVPSAAPGAPGTLSVRTTAMSVKGSPRTKRMSARR